MITASTRICALIGDPIGHSLSPLMHNAAFAHAGINYAYLAFRVEGEQLAAAISGMRALGIKGLNVTIPHKVAVIPLLDSLDKLAEKIGAVNTIVNDNGHLKGYNTDGRGFLKAILPSIEPRGRKAVILGAGGASRAISFTLAERGAELVILNRRQELGWAVELAKELSRFSGREVSALELSEQNLAAALGTADILINATSVGMHPDSNLTPVPESLIKPGLVVFDIVYNPARTRLLVEADSAGAKTIAGLDMLVWQGASAFELWTGVEAPAAVMKAVAISVLGEKAPPEPGEATDKGGTKTSIALIGFMGTGKTAVGRLLAEKLGKKLVELDSLIEQRAGKPIAEIFRDGETAFRQLEIEATKEVAPKKNQIIACGGGIVLNKINIDRLKQEAVVVCLNASPEAILKRVSTDTSTRPLLGGGDKAGAIRRLLEFRQPFYDRAADIQVATSNLEIEAVAQQIIARLKEL